MRVQAKRIRNPIIPGSDQDRTGTLGILRRAVADIRRRFVGLQADVRAAFERVPVLHGNDAAARTNYMLTPDAMQRLSAELQAAVDRWIGAGRDPSSAFWWSAYVAEAAQTGAAQSATNLAALSEAYAAARTVQQIIFSQPYAMRLAVAQTRSMDHWTGLGAEARASLSQVISRAVIDGKNPRTVTAEIKERLGVSQARAEQYAQTDITGTLREARWAEAEDAADTMGLKVALLWTSALLPSTRPHHAARNGKVYTPAEVKEFYGKDGNRYRCHCSQTECLLNDDGTPAVSDALKSTMSKARANWMKSYGSS